MNDLQHGSRRSLALGLLLGAGLTGCSSPAAAPESSSVQAPGPQLASELLDLRLKDLAGQEHSISETLDQGRSVALVFWQSWCGSCVAEAPYLAAAHRQYSDRLTVLGVVSGPDASVDKFKLAKAVQDLELPYANLRDRELGLTRGLGVTGTPTIFVIHPGGQVVYKSHEVPHNWDAIL